jgi:A/G-specific adenine glycosylase
MGAVKKPKAKTGKARAEKKPAKQKIAAAIPLPFSPLEFRNLLLGWYRQHARRLPWRGVEDPYATWLSEIMLQQTRVATVLIRYREFLERFPTLQALAAAEESEVLALWSGLGYYRRARMLLRGAQFVVRELDGKLPQTAEELRKLPGVGAYTAAAIASIAFGECVAVLDGNVERVLLRVLGLPEKPSSKSNALLMSVAQALMPRTKHGGKNPQGDHNQAMMELGATVCLPRSPLCLQCPVFDLCKTRGQHDTPQRPQQLSRNAAYVLALRKRDSNVEVLLEHRAANMSQMPGMLELPVLPLEAAVNREPVLRLRHSITNTNFYVQIYAESAGGTTKEIIAPALVKVERDVEADADPINEDEQVVIAEPGERLQTESLLSELPAAKEQLEWAAVTRLHELPLTGLTRKVLQRLRVMPMSKLI